MKYTVDAGKFQKYASLTETKCGDVVDLKFSLKFDTPEIPGKVKITWYEPVTETYSFWGPLVGTQRHLAPSWGPRISSSRLASGAPVHSVISKDGSNRLTVAVSDAATPLDISTGVVEHTAELECRVTFFTLPMSPITEYEATIRLFYAKDNFCDVLRAVSAWWEDECGYLPLPVPSDAKMPMNSLWYSYHQHLVRDEIASECRASAPYGMKTVIIDDGWQTADKGGYSHCGDWQPVGLPDIKETVEDVHAAGMKIILWYSVPFIGIYSEHFEEFRDMTLYSLFDDTTYCLDPRYKKVRDYLVDIYKRAMTEWSLDGMKLDFIDSFCHSDKSVLPDPRRDYISLDEAVDALMTEAAEAIKSVKPDAMIEFRQSYIGPAIRKFGNMLRVGDCPCDALSNRRAIIDLRLISGDTAVHSDMLMWNLTDRPEAVALQLGSVLFAVPQISVRLANLPADQSAALKFYLDFWCENRDVLMNGKLYAADPAVQYSSAYAVKDGRAVHVAYEDRVVRRVADDFAAVNCGAGESLIFDGFKGKNYIIKNCMGAHVASGAFASELEQIPVPHGAIVFIK